MLNSWFSSTSSRRQRLSSVPSDAPSRPSDASQSTVGPLQTPANLSASDAPIDQAHAPISVHARTPSLIHSTEKEAGTLGTSDLPPSLDATAYHPDTCMPSASNHVESESPFTPQDAILAQVLGKSVPVAINTAHATPPPPSNAPQPSVSLQTTRTSDSLPPLPSTQTSPPTSRARPGHSLTIYDPFSGTKLGERTPVSPLTATPGGLSSPEPPPTSDDSKLWSSLERILGLQAEIAAMHADMEGATGRGMKNVHIGGTTSVGTGVGGNVGPRKRSKRGQTLPIGDEEPEEPEPEGVATGGAVSEISTDHSDIGDEDEEDEDEGGIHRYGKKRRDEEFARLAEQFAQRKAAIGNIMNKLDDLSTALKTFHTLPSPLFDLTAPPSRIGTMSSVPSNASVTSSPSPLHVQPGRSSSPLLSILPTQVGKLAGTLPPPVPPISTLAASTGDPNISPSLGPMVAPVLPKSALPRIIPGAPHVDSPADVGPAHSVFI